MSLKITYNSPFILTFALISATILLYTIYIKDLTAMLALPGDFPWSSPLDYFKLFSYTLVHATQQLDQQSNFGHFLGNFTIILVLGPILEEKYGSKKMFYMFMLTALFTGIIHILVSKAFLLGASGLAFMLIILSSFSNYRKGDLPVTFIIICVFFLGTELLAAFQGDNISQLAHLTGGIIGAYFGFQDKKNLTK